MHKAGLGELCFLFSFSHLIFLCMDFFLRSLTHHVFFYTRSRSFISDAVFGGR
jgi:hypothetical protein